MIPAYELRYISFFNKTLRENVKHFFFNKKFQDTISEMESAVCNYLSINKW